MESFGLRIYCNLDDFTNKKVSLPSIVQNSELIQLMSENINNKDNKIEFDLKDKCDFETLMYLEKILSNFDKIKYNIDLDVAQNGDKLSNIMKYFMIDENKRLEIEEYIEMCKDFDWEEMIEANDMEEYFFSKTLYPENRKIVSIYPFLNTFLKKYYECSIEKIWYFISIFNKYVSNMRNLNINIPKEYHTINVFEFIYNYDNETSKLIRSFLLPESIYNFYDNDFDILFKYASLLEINNEFDLNEFKKFVLNHPDNEKIYFAGSSTLYCMLKNYEKSYVNDIDIWLNMKDSFDFCNRFFKKSINDFDTKSYSGKLRKGILDIERSKGTNIQFIHLDNKDGYDVIQTFDLPHVACYIQFKNKTEELIMTTHCMESLYYRKIIDFYNNEIDRISIQLKRRILKYSERGFTFDPYFYELIENFNENDITTFDNFSIKFKLSKNSNLDLPINILRKFSKNYFNLDFKKYSYDPFSFNIENKDLNEEERNIIFSNAKIINNNILVKLENKYPESISKIYRDLGLGSYSKRNSKLAIYISTLNFSRLLLIDYLDGNIINKKISEYGLFDFNKFNLEYDIDSVFYQKGKLFFSKK
jgi:hypothetical protein